MSLLKYREIRQIGRERVYWERADEDGAPYMGAGAPLLRNEEFEAYAQRRHDAHVRVFKMWEEPDRLEYQEVIDRTANRWYSILRDEAMPVPEKHSFVVFCIWTVNSTVIPQDRIDAIAGASK